MNAVKRYKVIACEILFREICAAAAMSPLVLDLEFLPKALHDEGEHAMSGRIQNAVNGMESGKYEAAILGYGLCNNGTTGLTAPVPMVIPRAHDCITLLLGSRTRYKRLCDTMPGTYFTSPGWLERNARSTLNKNSIPSQLGIHTDYEEYRTQYGEDNARFLMETIGTWFHNYRNAAYIDNGLGDGPSLREETAQFAREEGLEATEIQGDLGLLKRLLSGDWDDSDFLVVPPGKTIEAAYDESIMQWKTAPQGKEHE